MKRAMLLFPLLLIAYATPATADDADCDWADALTLFGCLHNTKHTINDVWNQVVATGAAVVDSTGATVMTVAKQTRDTGQQTLSTLEDVGDNVVDTMNSTFQIQSTIQFMQEAIDTMDAIAGDIERMALEAEDMLVYYAENELDEYESWAGSSGCAAPCQAFRGQLVDIFIGLQEATNTLIDLQYAITVQSDLSGLGDVPRMPHVNYQPLVEQLQNVPGAVLYPLYKGISVLENLPGATGKVGYQMPPIAAESCGEGCSNSLAFIIAALEAVYGLEYTPEILGASFGDCPSIKQPTIDATLKGFAAGLRLGGVPLKFIALILRAKGQTSVSGTHGGLAAAGHLSLRLEHNMPAMLGLTLNGIADFALQVASSISSQLRHCELVVNQQTLICMLDPPRPNLIPRDSTLAEYCRPAPLFPDL